MYVCINGKLVDIDELVDDSSIPLYVVCWYFPLMAITLVFQYVHIVRKHFYMSQMTSVFFLHFKSARCQITSIENERSIEREGERAPGASCWHGNIAGHQKLVIFVYDRINQLLCASTPTHRFICRSNLICCFLFFLIVFVRFDVFEQMLYTRNIEANWSDWFHFSFKI